MRFSGENLTCVRGERIVFCDLDFALGPADALILSGRNGSGKTSLLRLMAGLTRPAAGAVGWHDGPIAEAPERHRERTHYVGHLDAVKPALSVIENLMLWCELRGGGRAAAAAALESVGLAPLAAIPARFLSAGQRRRLALARLAAAPAPLWLLDEPTVALDRDSVAALKAALARHRAGGGIAVVASNVEIAIEGAVRLDLARFAPPAPEATVP